MLNLNKCNMQNNVNAVNVLSAVTANFGSDRVTPYPDGSLRLKVKELGNGDILNISNMLVMADVKMCRSDKNIIVLFFPKA